MMTRHWQSKSGISVVALAILSVWMLAGSTGCHSPESDPPDSSPTDPADTSSSPDTRHTVDTTARDTRSDAAPADASVDAEADLADTGPPPTYTYHEDVKPIVEARCTQCHTPGGIGPFPLESYEAVKSVGAAVKSQVSQRIMPPYLAGDGCNTYKHDYSLTDEQVETITTWVDEGTPEGDPEETGDPLPTIDDGLSRVDRTVQMPKAYEPTKSPDDYRCIPVDWPGDKKKFVTGFGVDPDKKSIVHHVIAYLAPPELADKVDQKAAAEEGPGYTCFGGAGVGGFGLGADSVSWLGAWAPGTAGGDFPDGTGIPIRPGSKIILQVHYNTLTAEPVPDQSSVKLRVDDSVQQEAAYIPWTNPDWLRSEEAMKIPAGAADVSHDFSFDLVTAANQFTSRQISSVDIYDVFFHMHKLGESGRMWVDRRDGSEDCLLDIPRWDFDWQRGYRLDSPVNLQAGDRLGLKCSWDNSAANQPVIDGEKQSPTDVSWGEGTQDEMCLGVLYVTLN